jgi:hypothetical protein
VAAINLMESNSDTAVFDLGRCIGQGQAFGLVASKCSAAQAQCLQSIREQRHYETLGLTWEEFCRQHAGISRSYADQLIRNVKQFGEDYFRLSQILHISETAYREVSGAVTAGSIELDGESIPIVPENAARIRQAVAQLRGDLHQARANRPTGAIMSLQGLLDTCFNQMADIARISLDPAEQAGLRGLSQYSLRKLKLIPVPIQTPRN